jgi:hypothetical protein
LRFVGERDCGLKMLNHLGARFFDFIEAVHSSTVAPLPPLNHWPPYLAREGGSGDEKDEHGAGRFLAL